MCRTIFWDAWGKPPSITFNRGRVNRLTLSVPLKPIYIPSPLTERGGVDFAFIYHFRTSCKPAFIGAVVFLLRTSGNAESGVLRRTAGIV